MGHAYVVRGTIHIYTKKEKYLECRILVTSKDIEKIKNLSGKKAHLIIITED